MSKRLRSASAVLAALFAATILTPALAAETEAPAAEPSAKEEVIYFTLDASGAVESAYAVNSFPGGDITDYGDYSDVKVLNTEDEITYEGGVVRLSSDAAKVYYQGTLKDPVLPWNIELAYTLDGKSISPDELGGKSGKLVISFNVTKNEKCSGSFYSDYALQANFTLPGECCTNISAPDATIASVGADKQLTYTLLPGEGIATTITAEVEDFHMPAVSINGIHLNLDVDVDTEGLKDQVGELISATSQLNDGAAALYSGSEALRTGASGLLDGSEDLHSGIAQLDAGVSELQDGLVTMRDGLNELYSRSPELVSGSAQVYSALTQINTTLNTLDLDTALAPLMTDLNSLLAQSSAVQETVTSLQTAAESMGGMLTSGMVTAENVTAANDYASSIINEMLINDEFKDYTAQLETVQKALSGSSDALNTIMGTVSSSISSLNTSASALVTQLTELNKIGSGLQDKVNGVLESIKTQLGTLKAAISQLTTQYATLDAGISSYTGGVAQLVTGFGSVMSGVSALAEGSSALLSGSDDLNAGAAELYNGVADLCSGAQTMANGAGALHTETSGLDVQAEVDSLLAGIGGNMDSPTSFVSEENGTISSVQFVISTAEIAASADDTTPEPEPEQPTLWERFLALFGL